MAKTATKVKARRMDPNETDEGIQPGRAPKLADQAQGEETTSMVALTSGGVGTTSAAKIAELLKSRGIGKRLTGGTLPLIKFTKDQDEGQGFVGRLVARSMAKDADQDDPHYYLSFDVLNVEKLVQNPKNVDAAVVKRAQLLESTSLKEWGEHAAMGEIVQITYEGDARPTKPGWSGMQHFTVEKLELGS